MDANAPSDTQPGCLASRVPGVVEWLAVEWLGISAKISQNVCYKRCRGPCVVCAIWRDVRKLAEIETFGWPVGCAMATGQPWIDFSSSLVRSNDRKWFLKRDFASALSWLPVAMDLIELTPWLSCTLVRMEGPGRIPGLFARRIKNASSYNNKMECSQVI